MFVESDKSTVFQLPATHPPRSWRTWLLGRPLSTADAPHQTIGKVVGLAVFASDALSSTAYATQEILVAQITSAFPALFPWRLEIAVATILFVMLINLRGVKELRI